MKCLTLLLLLILIAGMSCTTSSSATRNLNESVLMTIDCRNETDLKQIIVMRLRGTKARNLRIIPEGAFLKISAVFLKSDVSPIKLYTLSNDIRNMGGVLEIFMEENKGMVAQTIDRSPIN